MTDQASAGAGCAPVSAGDPRSAEHRVVVRNLVNAPFDLPSLDGPLLLPALGTTEPARFSDEQILLMRASLALEIVEQAGVPHPLDHDGDGKKGGSIPATDRDLDELRREYEQLTGETPDKRWGAPRLQTEIDKALAA